MSARSRSRRTRQAGLSLVEVSAIVSVSGVLLAIALPTLGRTIRPSKVTEASEQLEQLYQAAAAYYATPRLQDDGRNAHCLPAAAGPTPPTPSVDPVAVDFAHAPGTAAHTWTALGFAPTSPLRFRYSFLPEASGCSRARGDQVALVLRAEGDLDGDGVYSQFERRVQLMPHGELHAEPVLHIEDRVE
ncbi:MAG: hypothetical protein ABW321_05715 [Polyangiales bacterium]